MKRILYAGADVRVEPAGVGDWTAERRATYLLRPEVAFPLSVDPNVWERAPGDVVGALPWVSVAETQRRASTLTTSSKLPLSVAIFGAAAEDAAEEEDLRARIGADATLTIDSTWTFVGFDVADGTTGVSGLSNCGYGDEIDVLRAAWAPRLNDWGLLRALDDAFAFRGVTDARVPEHAPFTVYGIWLSART